MANGKGKGEVEGEVKGEGAELHIFLFAPKCPGNAESDIDCKYGNAISILPFWTFFRKT